MILTVTGNLNAAAILKSMSAERFKVKAAVGLLLKNGDNVFMLRRTNTASQNGQYSLIAGHLESGESLTAAVCREAQEETGVIVRPPDLQFIHTMHRRGKSDYLDYYFAAEKWTGEPYNAEPAKCDDARWFDSNSLPAGTQPFVGQVIEYYRRGVYYSELGW